MAEKSLEQNIEELKSFVESAVMDKIKQEYPEVSVNPMVEPVVEPATEPSEVVPQTEVLPAEFVDLDDPRLILNKQLQTVLDIIEVAKVKAYEDTRGGKVYPLTTLIETAQNLIADMDRLRNTQELSVDILRGIVQPLIRNMYRAMTMELNKVLDEMVKYVAPENINIVNHAFNQALKGIGAQTDVIYEEIKPKIIEILNLDTASKNMLGRKAIKK